MYFITDTFFSLGGWDDEPLTIQEKHVHPKLFNTDAHVIYTMELQKNDDIFYNVKMNSVVVYSGTEQHCEDFVYALAGYVGAVNPMAKAGKS